MLKGLFVLLGVVVRKEDLQDCKVHREDGLHFNLVGITDVSSGIVLLWVGTIKDIFNFGVLVVVRINFIIVSLDRQRIN